LDHDRGRKDNEKVRKLRMIGPHPMDETQLHAHQPRAVAINEAISEILKDFMSFR
jgi:hypothetical protein